MTGSPEERLAELGHTLPAPPAPAAAYTAWTRAGDIVYTAGQIPRIDGQLTHTGKVGAGVSVDEAVKAAEACALNILAVAKAAAGALEPVRVLKLNVFVASVPEFTEPHVVADGASKLIAAVLGEAGTHARSAVGVPVLPLDVPVEVEAILELRYE